MGNKGGPLGNQILGPLFRSAKFSEELVEGMLAFSSRKAKRGGGSVQQPLDYMDPTYPKPNAAAGQNLLVEQGGIARPMIGGFLPSVMKGVVNSGALLGPLAAVTAKRMWNDAKTRKRGGAGKGASKEYFESMAEIELGKYGKPPTKKQISKYATALSKAHRMLKKHGTPSDETLHKIAHSLMENPKEAQRMVQNFIFNRLAVELRRPAHYAYFNVDGDVIVEENISAGKPPRFMLDKEGFLYRANDKKTRKSKKVSFPNVPATLESAITAPPIAAPPAAPAATIAKIQEEVKKDVAAAKKMETVAKKVREGPTEKQLKLIQNTAAAKEYLSQFGTPIISNLSKFVSAKRKGENVTAIIEAVKARKTMKNAKKNKGALTTLAEGVANTMGLSVPVAKTQTRKYQLSNEVKALRAKAQANLASLGRQPKAHEIGSLAALRRTGKDNAEFLRKYGENIPKTVVAPAAVANNTSATSTTQKRKYQLTNMTKTLRNKARANLAARGREPRAGEIRTLAALRRAEKNNAEFLSKYNLGPQPAKKSKPVMNSENIINLNTNSETNE